MGVRPSRWTLVLFTTFLALLLLGACGSSDDTDDAASGGEEAATPTEPADDPTPQAEATVEPTATTAPEPEPEPTATPEPAPTAPEPTAEPETETEPDDGTAEASALPETPASVAVAEVYDFAGGAPDPALLPAQAGDVTARWYRAGGVYAVVYDGLAATVDACPGNSVLTDVGFEHVSNAELPNAACPDFATRIDNTDTQGVQICDGRVGYLTLIPADVVGRFFASIEKPVDADIGGVGLTSNVVIADPSTVPEIDPTALVC